MLIVVYFAAFEFRLTYLTDNSDISKTRPLVPEPYIRHH